MAQKWIHILMILVFYQKMTSGAGEDIITAQEGNKVDIKCIPSDVGTLIIWFRVLDTPGVEFIGSFTNNGMKKIANSPLFSYTKMSQNILTLLSFKKNRDSGTYTCASLKSNELKFGKVTQLVGEKAEIVTKAPPTIVTKPSEPTTTTTACVCKGKTKQAGEVILFTWCTPIILGPLAGSCALLLLLLIIVSVYCNHIRTRRCPHHYKRKSRTVAPGKQVMVNRHI